MLQAEPNSKRGEIAALQLALLSVSGVSKLSAERSRIRPGKEVCVYVVVAAGTDAARLSRCPGRPDRAAGDRALDIATYVLAPMAITSAPRPRPRPESTFKSTPRRGCASYRSRSLRTVSASFRRSPWDPRSGIRAGPKRTRLGSAWSGRRIVNSRVYSTKGSIVIVVP